LERTLVLQSPAVMHGGWAWDFAHRAITMRKVDSSDDLFTVGFYNVGIQQRSLQNKKSKAEKKITQLVSGIVHALANHNLDLLGICELGGGGDMRAGSMEICILFHQPRTN